MGKFKRKNVKYIPDPNNKKARSWSEYMSNLEEQKEKDLEWVDNLIEDVEVEYDVKGAIQYKDYWQKGMYTKKELDTLSQEESIKILSDEKVKINKRLFEINRDIYFLLYDMLNDWNIKYNPCQFEGNKCIKNRKDNTINGCCPNCPNNTLVGCKIKSIGCKLFLCQESFNNLSDEAKEEFRKIEYLIDDLGVNKELRKTFNL